MPGPSEQKNQKSSFEAKKTAPIYISLINKFHIEFINKKEGICIYLTYQDHPEEIIEEIIAITIPFDAFVTNIVSDKEGSFSELIQEFRSEDNLSFRIPKEKLRGKGIKISNTFANVGSFSFNSTFGGEFWVGIIVPSDLAIKPSSKGKGTKAENITINSVRSFLMLPSTLAEFWSLCLEFVNNQE